MSQNDENESTVSEMDHSRTYINGQTSKSETRKYDDGNSKHLKFGIDTILAKEYPTAPSYHSDLRRVPDTSAFSASNYQDNTLHYCYQFDNGAEASVHFYPSLYISSRQILPSIRRFTNFVIETDRNLLSGGTTSKRKRIWSRAVFSKFQRKGLEKRFQVQKYIMKPDRKQLAASLGLTDAQVKVWFQNRRMKWRNRHENSATNKSENDKTKSK